MSEVPQNEERKMAETLAVIYDKLLEMTKEREKIIITNTSEKINLCIYMYSKSCHISN